MTSNNSNGRRQQRGGGDNNNNSNNNYNYHDGMSSTVPLSKSGGTTTSISNGSPPSGGTIQQSQLQQQQSSSSLSPQRAAGIQQMQQQMSPQLQQSPQQRFTRRKSFMDRLKEEGAVPRPAPRHVSSLSVSIRDDAFLSQNNNDGDVSTCAASEYLSKYEEFPLAQSLLRHNTKRVKSLKNEGQVQVYYHKSNDGWITTLFMTKGRALDWMGLPFIFSVLHAILFVILHYLGLLDNLEPRDAEITRIFFIMVLNSTLSALLMFRLNRAQDHYWLARTYWGNIIEKSRTFVGGMIIHGSNINLIDRDHAIRWIAAFVISIMELMRGTGELPINHFAGILTYEEIHQLADNAHPPVYAANKAREHLRKTFAIHADTPMSITHARIRHIDFLEGHLNKMLDGCGGLQRIRSTPLPIVCVSLLRSLLMMSIVSLPWIWGPYWKWRTIPIVGIAAFAWFGIEATSAEIESPFREDRVNALNMDGYCIGMLQTLSQQVINHADDEIQKKILAKQEQQTTTTNEGEAENNNSTVNTLSGNEDDDDDDDGNDENTSGGSGNMMSNEDVRDHDGEGGVMVDDNGNNGERNAGSASGDIRNSRFSDSGDQHNHRAGHHLSHTGNDGQDSGSSRNSGSGSIPSPHQTDTTVTLTGSSTTQQPNSSNSQYHDDHEVGGTNSNSFGTSSSNTNMSSSNGGGGRRSRNSNSEGYNNINNNNSNGGVGPGEGGGGERVVMMMPSSPGGSGEGFEIATNDR